jgi:hypothetical protein
LGPGDLVWHTHVVRPVPPELIAVIEADDCALSSKAVAQYLTYGYTDDNCAELARTGYLRKKQIDNEWTGDYKWTIIGADTHGRSTYMAGKVVLRNGEKTWFVITIHLAR